MVKIHCTSVRPKNRSETTAQKNGKEMDPGSAPLYLSSCLLPLGAGPAVVLHALENDTNKMLLAQEFEA